MKRALLLVDIQNDFIPGGALPTRDGAAVIPIANRLLRRFDLAIATQDWHPQNHGSFASNHPGRSPGEVVDLDGIEQILWPDHCVQDSPGAEFHPDLDREKIHHVVRKGTDPRIDSYSGFFDNGHRKATGMDELLRSLGVTDVWLAGLATDYCVKYTALDAVSLGYSTHVIEDACRGVELHDGDIASALAEMRTRGCEIVQSADMDAGSGVEPS